MSPVELLTHDQIAELAVRKLKSIGYIAAFANIASAAAGEQPDALGINSAGRTFLVEVKVSRSDFAADKKKPWRQEGSIALGHSRAYLTPKGLLKPSEVPYGWQLWEVHGTNKPIIKVIKGMVRQKVDSPYWGSTMEVPANTDKTELAHFSDKACTRTALGLMATILCRMDADGIEVQQFANRGGKGFLKR